MRKIKILSIVLAAVMLISSVSLLAFAEGPAEVTDYASFVAAVANGGEITLGSDITLEDTVAVTKDTTINFGQYCIYLDNSYLSVFFSRTADNMFVVTDAKLTLNLGNTGRIQFMGKGSPFKAESGAELVINGGSHSATGIYNNETNGFDYPASYINITGSDASVVINGGGYSVERLNSFNGPLFTGTDANISVIAGLFSTNVSDYVAEGSVAFGYEDNFEILKIDAEPIAEVRDYLNSNGELVFKRVAPKDEMEFYLLIENLYYDSSEFLGEYYLDVVYDDFDAERGWAYFKVCYTASGNLVQALKLPFVFEYDEEMVAKVSEIIEALPKGEETPNGYIPYCYKVQDLEVVNYWLTCNEENRDTNISNFINYSDDFKKNLGYKNFAVEMRYGADERLYTFAGGTAEFLYDGSAYGVTELEVKGEHVFYVPDNTADTPEALLAAFESRVDEYIGSGKVEAQYLGTALEVLQKDTYESLRYEWEQVDPDMTFEEWKQSAFYHPIDVANDLEIEGVTDATPIFTTTINNIEHQFLIFRDSSKMANPLYKSVDVESNVAVELSKGTIPLDTLIGVEKLTSGAEYERIQQTLKPKESVTFDINLHSNSLGEKITRLDSGEFWVYMPIPEDFKDKDLEILYVHENGVVEEFVETIENGYIKFPTNHFSAYTLVVNEKNTGGVGGSSSIPADKPNDSFTETESSKTADTTRVELWTVLSAMSAILLAATVLAKKKLEA